MAEITSKDIVVGLKKGVTWGTEVVITSGIYLPCSSAKVSGGFNSFEARDVGTSGFKTTQARLGSAFNVTWTMDTTHGNGWLALLASLMGTESSPSETTPSQGDYLVNIDLAASNDGLFWTCAWSIESNKVMVLPSVKVGSVKGSIDINGAGQLTFTGIADRFMVSSTSTVANIAALTQYTYQTATMGGANHYFRFGADTGGSFSSSNDLDIQGIDFEISRNLNPRYGFRAGNTPYTKEPYQTGLIKGSLRIRFSQQDASIVDVFADYYSSNYKKAEFFIDGSQIAAGANRSLKIQWPYLQNPGSLPEGFDFANNSSLLLPVLDYSAMKRSAAPTGMSGVTNYMRVVSVQERATKWTA